MPNASSGCAPAVLKAPIPNGRRMPAIMPLATPLGTRTMIRSSEPERPIPKRMTAAVR